MIRKKLKIILLLLILVLCNGNIIASEAQVKIKDIKYIFYTEITKPGTSPPRSLVQGKELTAWPDSDFDVQPNVFDIIVVLSNSNSFNIKSEKLKIEFFLAESLEFYIEEDVYDIEKMRSLAKWCKLWEKEIDIQNLKPNEIRKIKIGRVKIMDIGQGIYEKKQLVETGWLCKATIGKSKLEKKFLSDFLD